MKGFFVLIGSRALCEQGYLRGTHEIDIDLVCGRQEALELSMDAPGKLQRNLLVFGEMDFSAATEEGKKKKKRLRSRRVDLEDESCDSSSSSAEETAKKLVRSAKTKVVDLHVIGEMSESCGASVLYTWAKDNADLCKKISIELSDTYVLQNVLVPPIEWLYALYRGHIHRIPRVYPAQRNNIALWNKYMDRYLSIREQYGYAKLDKEFSANIIAQSIFHAEFEECNRRLGEAPELDGKTQDEFFKDAVERYMDHDELHKRVAKMFQRDEPLFTKYVVNPAVSVAMDKDRFLAASNEEKLAVIVEEITVLYLERKVIPAAAKFGEELKKLYELDEIICHFICNLCGRGWLRQWCLDHYHLIRLEAHYPLKAMQQFILIFRHRQHDEIKTTKIETIEDLLAYHAEKEAEAEAEGVPISGDLLQGFKNLIEQKEIDPVKGPIRVSVGDGDGDFDQETCAEAKEMLLCYDEIPPQVIEKFFPFDEKCTDIILITGPKDAFYNVTRGIYLLWREDTYFVSIIECMADDNFVQFTCTTVGKTPEDMKVDEVMYREDIEYTTYSKSNCGDSYEVDRQRVYLGKYGTTDAFIGPQLEDLARIFLGRYTDESDNDDSY